MHLQTLHCIVKTHAVGGFSEHMDKACVMMLFEFVPRDSRNSCSDLAFDFELLSPTPNEGRSRSSGLPPWTYIIRPPIPYH